GHGSTSLDESGRPLPVAARSDAAALPRWPSFPAPSSMNTRSHAAAAERPAGARPPSSTATAAVLHSGLFAGVVAVGPATGEERSCTATWLSRVWRTC